jgi:hypothetical protein
MKYEVPYFHGVYRGDSRLLLLAIEKKSPQKHTMAYILQ